MGKPNVVVCSCLPSNPQRPVRATRLLGVEDRRPRHDSLARLQLLDLDLELGLEHLEGLDLGFLGGPFRITFSSGNAVIGSFGLGGVLAQGYFAFER